MTDNKKLFALLLAILLIPVVSCGTSEQESESEIKEQSTIEQEATQEEQNTEEQEEAEEMDEDPDDEEMKDENSNKSENEESEELDEELIAKGEKVYQGKACSSCHTFGKGRLVGPDLLGVTERRDHEWLKKWLTNPDEMLRTDPIAKEMLKEYMVPMPNQGLTDEEISAVLEYMKHKDQTN